MQKTSRTPPVVAIENIESNVVRLQRRRAASREGIASLFEEIETLPDLMERVSNAARQMRYFALATKRFSFDDLTSSARRAGFFQIQEDPELEDASFQWASGTPDLIFYVSFRDPDRIATVAESQGDIFGLILTAYSHLSTTSVEINPTVEDRELGHNALVFRDMLLATPGFDNMPAWAKYPEGFMPDTNGMVEMWRNGVSVSSVFSRAWKSILPLLIPIRETLQRWGSSRQISGAEQMFARGYEKKAGSRFLLGSNRHDRPQRSIHLRE